MKIDLDELATVTGGTLVVAAGKKAAKPNIQHHKTFGVKKPKGALPGASAGGWLKKGGKKVIIPDTRNADLVAMLKKYKFIQSSSGEYTYTVKSGKDNLVARIWTDGTDCTVEVSKTNQDGSAIRLAGSNVGIHLYKLHVGTVRQVTAAYVSALISWMKEVAEIRIPKEPKFPAK